MPGYRGRSFVERASDLPFADWQSVKELLIAMGNAIDKLEQSHMAKPDSSTDGDPPQSSLQED